MVACRLVSNFDALWSQTHNTLRVSTSAKLVMMVIERAISQAKLAVVVVSVVAIVVSGLVRFATSARGARLIANSQVIDVEVWVFAYIVYRYVSQWVHMFLWGAWCLWIYDAIDKRPKLERRLCVAAVWVARLIAYIVHAAMSRSTQSTALERVPSQPQAPTPTITEVAHDDVHETQEQPPVPDANEIARLLHPKKAQRLLRDNGHVFATGPGCHRVNVDALIACGVDWRQA